MSTKFQVKIAKNAEREAKAIRDYIARDKKIAAAKWLRGFYRHARSLSSLPFRYEVIPEAELLEDFVRHIIYGNYRIIYRIAGQNVIVLHVIHAAEVLDPEFFEQL